MLLLFSLTGKTGRVIVAVTVTATATAPVPVPAPAATAPVATIGSVENQKEIQGETLIINEITMVRSNC